jgi:hypothetical protein
MDSTVLVAILGTGGFSAIAAAVITGLFSKRKLGAEATQIIASAAASVVTDLRAEVDRQKAVTVDLVAEHKTHIETLMASHAEEIEEFRRVLQLHVAWDAIAIAEMAKMGVELPPAPPLLPARRFDHPSEA